MIENKYLETQNKNFGSIWQLFSRKNLCYFEKKKKDNMFNNSKTFYIFYSFKKIIFREYSLIVFCYFHLLLNDGFKK